jgi:hypothetical protein
MFKATQARLVDKCTTLEKENLELKTALMFGPSTEDTWARHAPQELRDQMAAQALFAEKLDEIRALQRLGFKIKMKESDPRRLDPGMWEMCERIFGTPGVKAILERDMTDAQAHRVAVTARLIQIAEHGSDAEAVRATQQLAKMADWNEGDKAVAKAGAASNVQNFLMMLAEKRAGNGHAALVKPPADDDVIDADHFLVHTPGEAAIVADIGR